MNNIYIMIKKKKHGFDNFFEKVAIEINCLTIGQLRALSWILMRQRHI